MNKKELQKAFNSYKTLSGWAKSEHDYKYNPIGNLQDSCEKLEEAYDIIQNHINSLPDDYEPIPKEVKLSEVFEKFKKIHPFATIDFDFNGYIDLRNREGILGEGIGINRETRLIEYIVNTNWCKSKQWLFGLANNETKIIDDLGYENE